MDQDISSTERKQHFESGSSTSGDTDGYMTPDEYGADEDLVATRSPDEETREALHESEELKLEGTEYFRSEKWAEALQGYRSALARLPRRRDTPKPNPKKGKGKAKSDDSEEARDDSEEEEQGAVNGNLPESSELSELEQDCARARSVLNSNIGACHVKLGEHKDAVAACTLALLDDPHYVKALHRRATSNEILSTWSSLAAAEEDYNTLIKLLPASSPLLSQTRLALHRIKPRREAAQKAETAEMMDKLKGLGNSLLGNFGLSTDNFKFEPNGQGGYSMNFVR